MARISVILPIYNSEKYIGKAIESVLGQTFTDFELNKARNRKIIAKLIS